MPRTARVTLAPVRLSNPGMSRVVSCLVVVSTVAVTLALPAPGVRATQAEATERSLRHGGRKRTYLVHDFGTGEPAPVVIVLHGGGGNAENAVRMTGFDRIAARDRFIAVYPNGTAGRERGRLLTWNAGHCCAAAMDATTSTTSGFIGAIIDALVRRAAPIATRVYVTGMSNGGMMAHRLGRELSTKIAAIAPVVGAVFGDEAPPLRPDAGLHRRRRRRRGGAAGRWPAAVARAARPTIGRRPRRGAGAGAGHLLGPAQRLRRAVTTDEPGRAHVDLDGLRAAARRSSSTASPATATRGRAARPDGAGAATPTTAFDATDAMWTFFKTQRRPARQVTP